MGFSLLIEKWCNLSKSASIIIVTDNDRLRLALDLKSDIINNSRIINVEEQVNYLIELCKLSPHDLVIVLFSFDTFVLKGANKIFSPFDKPQGISAKYAFIRLSISRESLLEGLSTSPELINETINRLHSIPDDVKLQVSNPAGTEISLKIKPFGTVDYRITSDGGMAFLPPSEISSDVIPHTANGKIVVDVTIGQLYYYHEFLGYFGLVKNPVTLIVQDGIIIDIYGCPMANELKIKLFALPKECRILVELGHGLSKMNPTGLIGVDESIINTCHFGIGDGGTSGVHLDVVIKNPVIREV